MIKQNIHIVNASQNNLKNISLDVPKHCLTTVVGVSGSGKSTLVFDVIYTKAEKEFLESMSAYARRSFPKLGDVEVQDISGLSPCIVIDQSSFPNTPRSTVGTYTDIYTYLRLLFSRAGDSKLSAGDFSFNNAKGACPTCNGLGDALTPNISKLLNMELSLNQGAIQHKTWKVNSRYWKIIRSIGYFDMDKKLKNFTEEEMDHLLYSEPYVYKNDNGNDGVESFSYEGIIRRLKKRRADQRGLSAVDYDTQFFTEGTCPQCHGARLNSKALSVKIGGKYTIGDCVNMEISDLYEALRSIHGPVEDTLIPPILKNLKHIIDIGMGYITLNRSTCTLSGGEAQKIKLAKALGCSLSDMIYVLDEPTAGMHAADIHRMQKIIRGLVDNGNTAIVIDHNREMISFADHIIEIGPGAGIYGGQIIFQGTTQELMKCEVSSTAPFMTRFCSLKSVLRRPRGTIVYRDINANNVHHLNLKLPQGIFVCMTGVSGAGKSTVLNEIIERSQNVVVVDQNLVGTTNRGNAVTYTKIFDQIRSYFSDHSSYEAADFSFNSRGCCEACNGMGYIVTDMHFLGDIRVLCESCGGKRYKPQILACRVNGKNISDVLEMTIVEALEYFSHEPRIRSGLQILADVGLDYITLGQPLSTFSGGELQRLKLAGKIQSHGSLYIFDEPTHGLHFKDTEKLLRIINRIVDNGNTALVVEHNLDVIAQADWIIDMGPGGGKHGGKIIFEGTPSELCGYEDSLTGSCLRQHLARL